MVTWESFLFTVKSSSKSKYDAVVSYGPVVVVGVVVVVVDVVVVCNDLSRAL